MAVAPKHIYNAQIAQSISIGGKPFVQTGEPPIMRYWNAEYEYFYAQISYKNLVTMTTGLIPLPGMGTVSWLVSISYDGGQHWTNERPMTGMLSADRVQN